MQTYRNGLNCNPWRSCLGGAETSEKLQAFFNSISYLGCEPVAHASEGLVALKALGYRLKVVTARNYDHRAETYEWLDIYLPGKHIIWRQEREYKGVDLSHI